MTWNIILLASAIFIRTARQLQEFKFVLSRGDTLKYTNPHLTYKLQGYSNEPFLFSSQRRESWHTLLRIIIDTLSDKLSAAISKHFGLVFANVISQMERWRVFNYNKFSRLIESTCGIMKFFPSFARVQNTEIKRDINRIQKNETGNTGPSESKRERVPRFSLSCKRSWSRATNSVTEPKITQFNS